MQNLGTGLLVGGMLLSVLAQIFGAIIVFKDDLFKGVLSLLVPGYVLIALRRVGAYRKVMGTWFAGVLLVVVGTMLLS